MSNPIIVIHNVETGKIVEREMNAEELAIYEINLANSAKEKAAEEKAKADKQAAEAKLAALGLTADDLKALGLGGN